MRTDWLAVSVCFSNCLCWQLIWGFPGGSVGKESACNAGDPGSILGSGRSTEEGKGYPLQYSWASLVAQLIKNLPAMWETWVRFLGCEDPLEQGTAAHSSVPAWRVPGCQESGTIVRLSPLGQRKFTKIIHTHMCTALLSLP